MKTSWKQGAVLAMIALVLPIQVFAWPFNLERGKPEYRPQTVPGVKEEETITVEAKTEIQVPLNEAPSKEGEPILVNVITESSAPHHNSSLPSIKNIRKIERAFPSRAGDLVKPSVPNPAILLAAGGNHTCALFENAKVMCWGEVELSNRPVAIDFSGLKAAPGMIFPTEPISLAAGQGHACALFGDRTMACWGKNEFGELGMGTVGNRAVPVSVRDMTSAVEITAGGRHTCARLVSGKVACWGENRAGQVGDGTTSDHYAPVEVTGLSGAIEITAGNRHTCARLNDGRVHCWGDNGYGQLGVSGLEKSLTPVAVKGLEGKEIVQIAGIGDHTCALEKFGAFTCWGYNWDGLWTTTSNPSTIPFFKGMGIHQIFGGKWHTCARRNDDRIYCWGSNKYGQLGGGSSTVGPVAIEGLPVAGLVSAASGDDHICAGFKDGGIYCWGNNDQFQLGLGDTPDRPLSGDFSTVPLSVFLE